MRGAVLLRVGGLSLALSVAAAAQSGSPAPPAEVPPAPPTASSPEAPPAAPAPAAIEAAPANQFDLLSQQAAAAREAGRTDEALRLYREGLNQHPDWTEGLWYVANLSFDAKQYPDAIAAFNKYLEAHADFGEAWTRLGLCEFETGDYKSAYAHLLKGQDLGFGENQEAIRAAKYHLAALLNLNGEFEKASALLAAEYGQNDMPDEVKLVLGMALLRVPLLPAQVDPAKLPLLRAGGQAAEYLNLSDYDHAFLAFQHMLRDFPKTPYLNYAFAMALNTISRDGDAMAHLRMETKVTSENGLALTAMAAILLRAGAAEEGLNVAMHAVKAAPDSAAAHEVLGQIWKQLGKENKAEKELDAAKGLQPERPQIDANQARFYGKGGAV